MYQQGEFSIRTYVWFKPRLQRFGLFWSNRILPRNFKNGGKVAANFESCPTAMST
jgi:hypothetical protein